MNLKNFSYVIKCNLAGTLIINDLPDFRISGGQIVDLVEAGFDEDDLKKSMRPFTGELYLHLTEGRMLEVKRNSQEYREYRNKIDTGEQFPFTIGVTKKYIGPKKSKPPSQKGTNGLDYIKDKSVEDAIDFINDTEDMAILYDILMGETKPKIKTATKKRYDKLLIDAIEENFMVL